MSLKAIALTVLVTITNIAQAEVVQKRSTNGDFFLEDTTTGYLWQDTAPNNLNYAEAQSNCLNSDYGNISGWNLPSFATAETFLKNYHNQTPSIQAFSSIYGKDHWTTDTFDSSYRRSALISLSGVFDTGRYFEPTARSQSIIGKCYIPLPDTSPNGIATAPEYTRSKISTTIFKQGGQTYLKSYWKDQDDKIKYVKARYKNRTSGDWVITNSQYEEGITQFEAHYWSLVTVNIPGIYDVEFLAASEDGTATAESEWVSSDTTFTVQKDGVTPPSFSGGGRDAGYVYTGTRQYFVASWTDEDGDPYISQAKMRYKHEDDTVWSAEHPMQLNTRGDTYTTFKADLLVDNGAGNYLTQFKASSSSDSTETDAVESEWLPITPKTFTLSAGATAPVFSKGDATHDYSEITFTSSWINTVSGEEITDAKVRYRINGEAFQTVDMEYNNQNSYKATVPFSAGALSYQFQATTSVSDNTDISATSDWSPLQGSTFTGPNQAPLSPTITLAGASPGSGSDIYVATYNISATDPDGDVVHISCTFTDGNPLSHEFRNVTSGSTNKKGIGYASSGTKTVSCTAEDALGLKSNPTTKNLDLDTVITKPTLQVSTSGNGAVTSSPTGISCGSNCSESYDQNTRVTLTATPNSNSEFTRWSGLTHCTTAQTCEVVMTKDFTVEAIFTQTIDETPKVTSFSPILATLNELTTFTITGANLTNTTAAFIGECEGLTFTSRGSTKQTFQCTPSHTEGAKTYEVKDKSGGTVLKSGKVTVSKPIPAPTVSSFSPTSATFGKLTTFTITGANLTNTMAAFIGECEGLTFTSRGSTKQTFQCTPSHTEGTKAYEVKDKSGGTVLKSGKVTVSAPENQAPSAPTIKLLSTAVQGVATPITVTLGTDPEDEDVKVACSTSPVSNPDSNYDDGLPFESSFGEGGRTISLSPSLIFSKSGDRTIWCTTFDKSGNASTTKSLDITVEPTPTDFQFGTFDSDQAILNQPTTFTITGENFPSAMTVDIESCTDLTYVERTSELLSFKCTPTGSTGEKKLQIWDKPDGELLLTGSIVVSEAENRAPSKPTITVSNSATQGETVSVSVLAGIDPEKGQVKVHCSTGDEGTSNYTDSAPYKSSFGTGGRNITLSPPLVFNASGSQKLYCTTFDKEGNFDGTASETIIISIDPGTFILGISTSGNGQGTVTSKEYSLSCSSTCSQTFAGDTYVKLTATPSSGHEFKGWQGACSGLRSCIVSKISNTISAKSASLQAKTSTSDVSVLAQFEPIPVDEPAPISGKEDEEVTNTEKQSSNHDAAPECRDYQTTGNPIDLSSGAQVSQLPLLKVQGVLPIQFTLNYNSIILPDGDVGRGWSHSNGFNALLEEQDNGNIIVHWSNNRRNTFAKQSSGEYQSSEYACRLDTLTKNSKGFVLNRKNRMVYTFDSTGTLQSVTTPQGQILNFTFNEWNQLTKVSEPVSGVFLEYFYNSDKLLATVSDPLGREVRLSYDNDKNLTQIQDAAGNVTSYEYNTAGQSVQRFINVSEVVHARNAHDEHGRVIQQDDVRIDNQPIKITYDETSQADQIISTYTDRLGFESRTVHSKNYQLLEKVDALGGITKHTYDSNGKKTSTIDANNLTTFFTYDENGDLISSIDSLNRKTTFAYDTHRNLVQTTDALGQSTVYTYDDNNNRTSVTDAKGNKTLYSHNEQGQVIQIISPSGRVTDFAYENGRLIAQTDPEGNTTQFQYDLAGRKVAQIDPSGATTQYIYDELDRLIETIDPLGHSQKITYDVRGNVLTTVDAKGNTTQFEYDNVGNLIKKTDALGNSTHYEYDGEDQLISSTDALGNKTRYEYDALGRLIKVIDAQGNVRQTHYDAVGNVIAETDPFGVTTTKYEYDDAYNPTRVTNSLDHSWKTEYDPLNRPKRTIDPLDRTTQISYDPTGNVSSIIDPMGGQADQVLNNDEERVQVIDLKDQTRSEDRDKNGRLIRETTADGAEIYYAYDNRGFVTQVTNARGHIEMRQFNERGELVLISDDIDTTQYTYDPVGNLLETTNSQGTIFRTYDELNRVTSYTNTRGEVIRYGYDEVSNLVSLTYPDGKQVTYAYDSLNRLISTTDWNGRRTEYQYDAKSRLVKTINDNGTIETRSYNEADQLTLSQTVNNSSELIYRAYYEYDAAGNITKEQITPTPKVASFGNISMQYGAANRLTDFNGNSFDSDADGNMLRVPTTHSGDTSIGLSFDVRGRVSKAGDLSYQYDAENNRIQVGDRLHTINSEASLSQLLIEQVNDEKDYFLYGVGLIGQQTSGQFYTFHYDLRGSLAAVTDEAGELVARFGYLPYGGQHIEYGGFDSPFGYNAIDGVQADLNGLYHMRARYYSPTLRRFVSKDPLRGSIYEAQTLNRLTYVSGNPVSQVDPLGLFSVPNWMIESADDVERFQNNVLMPIGDVMTFGQFSSSFEALDHSSAISNCLINEGKYVEAFANSAISVGAGSARVTTGALLTVGTRGTGKASQAILSKGDRIKMIADDIGKINAKNADDALKQINRIVDRVEDAHSGVKKVANPKKAFDGRMYGPRSDSVTRHSDGSITAKINKGTLQISANGKVTLLR